MGRNLKLGISEYFCSSYLYFIPGMCMLKIYMLQKKILASCWWPILTFLYQMDSIFWITVERIKWCNLFYNFKRWDTYYLTLFFVLLKSFGRRNNKLRNITGITERKMKLFEIMERERIWEEEIFLYNQKMIDGIHFFWITEGEFRKGKNRYCFNPQEIGESVNSGDFLV